jgi:allantoicase
MSMQDSTDDRDRRRVADDDTPAFVRLGDLASGRVGARAVAANDEFFAPRANLLKPEPAVFVPGRFTSRGKWMDGWETRRRRTSGHDWCVIQLGMRGRITGVDVDTSFFVGNHPSHCSIQALDGPRAISRVMAAQSGAPWVTIVPRTPLAGGGHNYIAVESASDPARDAWTHVRLNIYPDGGVARFRAYGIVAVDWRRVARAGRAVDLASISNGGLVLEASDMHFGAKDNMIMPGRATNMGDGWETRRRRGPGHDWAVVRLGAPGLVTCVEIDTNHFKGNYPESASLEGCLAAPAAPFAGTSAGWMEILPRTRLRANRRHLFSRELRPAGPVSHVRLNIFPDGGVSRLRIHGTLAAT